MNGKMRAGIMLRMAGIPNRNRKMVARLPVQNAIGSPSASKRPREPNRRTVSHAMSISSPMASGSSTDDEDDIFDELGEPLQCHQRRTDWNHQFDRPVLHAPLGERDLHVIDGIESESRTRPQHRQE